MLHPLCEKPARVLEIGSWEGRSALFFLNYLPLSSIVCIDPFEGNVEHQLDAHFRQLVPKAEAQFDCNLAAFADRVEKIKGSSTTVLPTLGVSGRRFDLAYVDGSHMAADVYSDAVLTWPMIEPGGIVIFDDYEWELMDHEHELTNWVLMLSGGVQGPVPRTPSRLSAHDRQTVKVAPDAGHIIHHAPRAPCR